MAEYIEREVVEKMLEGAQLISDADGEHCGYCTEDISIHSIPAADVEPVVHGRWVNRKVHGINYRICSVCGEYRPALNEFGKVAKRSYCPNCGAKMDID